ncbi:MAG: DUF6524 family protein [Azospirillaceae bacterium]
MARRSSFGFLDFFARLVGAFVLVIATFNPTEYSFYHWVAGGTDANLPLKIVAGLVLLIGYIIYLRATWRSIGIIGVVLVVALLAAFTWLLVDAGWISLSNPGTVAWLVIIVLAVVMAVGMSWSHVRRRLSGQYDVDEADL